MPAGQTQEQGERKGDLLRGFEGWHEPVERLIESTPDAQILRNDIYDIEPMRSWHAGRVVLLGDAAHPTTPNMGQGACMAIESAYTLARSLSEAVEVEGALVAYEKARMKRTAWVTRQSRLAGRVGQVEGRVACAARDLLLSVAPKSLMRRTFVRAVSFEV